MVAIGQCQGSNFTCVTSIINPCHHHPFHLSRASAALSAAIAIAAKGPIAKSEGLQCSARL